ncbi:MAG: TonB-dependent receptor plug domain-containing protein [Reichenbachiella sp.]|uniref:TonB-dependent receptor n=1 Tax=Reichenbachiella sp. TaxID=2184521 RepID=UPI0032994426
MIRIFLTSFLLCSFVWAQPCLGQKITIQGYLKDAATGEALLGATVVDTVTSSGSVSNYYGFYSITLPAGQRTLKYAYVGYESIIYDLFLESDTVVNVDLNIQVLNEVVISSQKMAPIQETTEMGTFNISSKQIKNRPAIGGEVDLIKVLQLLPGVQSGREGSAGLYVRGGGPDQNLILLDGVPVYNANHLFGFMSVFNTDAINNVKLVKGAFPARYGGRLSSVVDISMKEGNNKEFHGEGALGLISTKLMLEGPIKSEKTSFAISGRRTYADLLAQPFIRKTSSVDFYGTYTEDDPFGKYYFYDLTGKINHKFSDKDRIFFSVYHGKDLGSAGITSIAENEANNFNRYYESDGGLEWGSSIGVVRWNHVFAPKIFGNTSISYSHYGFESKGRSFESVIDQGDTTVTYQRFDSQSEIEDWSAKMDFDYYPNPNHAIRFGLGASTHKFVPNVFVVAGSSVLDSAFNDSNTNAVEYFGYAEDEIKWSRKISSNFGVHYAVFQVDGKTYQNLQPRLSFRFLLNENNSIKASYSRMAQFLHLLTNPGVGVPTDFWVPATGNIAPQEGEQVSLGWFHGNSNLDFEFSVEAYYKQMENLLEYKEGASFLDRDVNWQDKVEIGKGLSYGIEFYVKKSFGKTDGWVGYTLSRTERSFDNLNHGETFLFKYDRTHDISAAINHQLSDKVFVSANWVLGSGSMITLPTYERWNSDPYMGGTYQEYTSRNGYRMRTYHRLDLSIRFHKKKKWGERNWVISVYNAYSRRNPFYIKQQAKTWGNINWEEGTKFQEYTLFPIIPSVSYQFKF